MLDYQTLPTRGTLKACMVWAGVWDTVNNIGLHPGQDTIYRTPFAEAPTWYSSLLDPGWPYSLVNWVETVSHGQLVLDTDAEDVHVRNRATRERYNYFTDPQIAYDYSLGWPYASQLLSEIDEDIDFSEYDANEDGGVDLFMIMMDYPFDAGQAHISWYELANDTTLRIDDYVTNDTTADGDSVVIQQQRSLIVWVDSRVTPNEKKRSSWNSILTHEFSHLYGVDHESRYYGTGAFSLMSGTGFADADTVTIPSPYIPAASTGSYYSSTGIETQYFYYSLPDCVVTSVQNSTLRDFHTFGDAVMVVPDQSTGAEALNYFLITNHKRLNQFELNWPGTGLLITHVDRAADDRNAPSQHKRFDIEHPMGLFDWIEPYEDRDTVGVFVWGNDTAYPDPIEGLDSMDYNATVVDSVVAYMYPFGRSGGPGCFWQAGMEFTPFTNPNTNLYDGLSQSIPSDISISNIRYDDVSRTYTVDAYTDRWAGTYPNDAVWRDTVFVESNLAIAFTSELTIEPGTNVYVDAGATITIGGSLVALGTADEPITFRAKDTGERWNGLTIVGGSLEMDYVNLRDFKDYGLYTEAPVAPVSINHVDFDCSSLKFNGIGLRLWNSPTVTQRVQNSVMHSVPSDSHVVGMNLYNCKLAFDNVTIEDCDWINSLIKKTSGSFTNCVFRDRAQNYAVLFTTAPNTPNFRCCTFENLAPFSGTWPTTIYCSAGTTPSFGAEGDVGDGASCTIMDSRDYLLTMSGCYTLPIVDSDPPVPPQYGSSNGGHNNWIQLDGAGKFFRNLRDDLLCQEYPCTEQSWNPWTSSSMYTPQGRWDYEPMSLMWPECGGGTGSAIHDGLLARDEDGTLDDGEYDVTMNEALQFEQAEDYAAAQELFRYVAENTSDTIQRWNALTHIVVCESFTLDGGSWLPVLVDDMIEQENSYESRVLGERLRASFYQNREEYDAAIETCVNLLGSGLTFEDSIQVAMDLLGIQSSMGEGAGGSLDGMSATHMIPASLRAETSEEVLQIERNLFALLSPNPEQPRESASIPVEFKLYPNHPNPFNPSTLIEFDIPEALPVTLTIFNSLGQTVATIIGKPLQAGHHTVTWDGTAGDGSEVATGLYIYQIKAGSFTDSKKMVLMR